MVSRADCRHRGPGIKSHKERKLFGGGGEGAERAGAVGGSGNYLGGGDFVRGEEDCCHVNAILSKALFHSNSELHKKFYLLFHKNSCKSKM